MKQTRFNEELYRFVEEYKKQKQNSLKSLRAVTVGQDDQVSGDMNCSDIADVNQNAGMDLSDFNACAMVMTVCQNMIQKTISDAAYDSGISASVALKNMNAWIQAFVDFPLPFFNFVDTQSNTHSEEKFKLSADSDVVDKILNIKNVADLKDSVSAALHKTGGDIASYEGKETHFNYFGVIKVYFDTRIEFRVVKFSLNLKNTQVKLLCSSSDYTKLDSAYDTYRFEADKDFMILMQKKMGEQMAEIFAEKLLEFVKAFYQTQLDNFKQRISELFTK